MKIYTRTGDNFTTSALSKRVYKSDDLMECIGTIDELSAHIMLAVHNIENDDVKTILTDIVKELFNVASDVLKYKDSRLITKEKVLEIETLIDDYQEQLTPLKGFIFPGTNECSSLIHITRTICRRLERRLVAYGLKEDINMYIFQYINRLSDLLFVLGRFVE